MSVLIMCKCKNVVLIVSAIAFAGSAVAGVVFIHYLHQRQERENVARIAKELTIRIQNRGVGPAATPKKRLQGKRKYRPI